MVADTLARTVTRLVAEGVSPDADLLRRFVAARDEAAFALLVRRHGPMVFGVCRRTLGHVQDAEDAFQATFLVLARKAHVVRPDGVGRWLYGVAVRVANKARVRKARRTNVPADLDQLAAPPAPPPADWLPHVDAALARMSARDRGPILLCDLLGRSRAEAAAELGVGEGTLSSRLARARGKLRTKLARLGVVPGVLAVAALAPESVPAALIDSTRAAGTAAARQLAEGVLRTMALTKLTTLAALGACLLGTAAVGIVLVPTAGAGPTPAAKETPKDAPAKEVPKPARSDAERFQGAWVVESARRNGESGDAKEHWWNGESMTFDRENVRFSRFPGREKTYKLDPGWDQKRIDFSLNDVPDGTGKRRVQIPAIYRFEGEKLHLVVGVVDLGDRPGSFDTSDRGPPFTHVILRRSNADDRDQAAEERKALEGTWVLVAVEQAGQRQETGGTNLTFKGDRITLRPPADRVPVTEGTYTLDVTTTPRQINLRLTAGPPESVGKLMIGIYVREGGLLRMRLNEDGKARPTTLADAAGGPPTMYFVLEGSGAKLPDGWLPKPVSPRIQDLQKARVKALEEQLQGQFERVKIGKDPLIQFIDAIRELGEAELELAATREARLAALERKFKYMRDVEEQVAQLQAAGLQTKQGVAQARAARLKAEIELEKLKEGK